MFPMRANKVYCDDCVKAARLAVKAAYRERNRETLRAKGRQYMKAKLEDPDYRARMAERSKRRREEDPEKAREIRQRHYWRNAEKKRQLRRESRRIKRQEIYLRDGGICYLCGQHISLADLEIDHVIPRSKGGTSDPENLRATHRLCNRHKGARLLPEAA